MYVVDSAPPPRHPRLRGRRRPGRDRPPLRHDPGQLRRHPLHDSDGNLWAAAGEGGDGYDSVHVLAPDGTLIGQVVLPESCANLCFGGAAGNRLFMAASRSIYALYVNATGA